MRRATACLLLLACLVHGAWARPRALDIHVDAHAA